MAASGSVLGVAYFFCVDIRKLMWYKWMRSEHPGAVQSRQSVTVAKAVDGEASCKKAGKIFNQYTSRSMADRRLWEPGVAGSSPVSYTMAV